ncbi:MAG: hypothetical protein U0800_12635 [Isosphaeraceae bacterium]
MIFLGIEVVNISSGMGGVLPAAVAARHDNDTAQVICLHEVYFPSWLLTVKQADITPYTTKLTEFAKRIIKERKRA